MTVQISSVPQISVPETEMPETGDGADPALWMAMLAFSAVGMIGVSRKTGKA